MRLMMQTLRRTILCIIAALVLLPSVLLAQSAEYRDLLDSGVLLFDPGDQCEGNQSSGSPVIKGAGLPSGSRIYMLGDSITVGAEKPLEASFSSEGGFEVQKIHGEVSRSIAGAGNGTFTSGGGSMSGLSAVNFDAADIEAADAIVVALGTNGSGANTEGITNMINAIRGLDVGAEVRIFWVNVFSEVDHKGEFNSQLSTLSAPDQLDFTVIDTTSAGIELSGDQIHPTPEGSIVFAETIAQSLGQGTQLVTPSDCACALPTGAGSKNERYQTAWAFFTNQKNISPEATAGIMGNLEAESFVSEQEGGIHPHNVQDSANRKGIPDGPEIPIDAVDDDGESFEGSYGYGIAQWTSSGRQRNLIAYAQETSRSTGNLVLQLDFLWKELEESYSGVLAELQTPGITIDDASYVFLSEFEIPLPFTNGDIGGQQREATNRLTRAQNIYNEYSGQTVQGGHSGGGCTATGGAIDLVSQDTSQVPCGGNTTDAGVEDEAYREGRRIVIRLCQVGGTQVNSQISGSIERMLADSSAAGINMSIGGFRSMDQQVSMYTSRCIEQGLTPTPTPVPYPEFIPNNYQRCDSIAQPGWSNHQAGFAIDVECDGELITRYHPAAASNRCFQWLSQNAAQYGLFEFGKGEGNRTSGSYEAWHWSVDGN